MVFSRIRIRSSADECWKITCYSLLDFRLNIQIVGVCFGVIHKLGTLRSDNGDVHENVAEKQTSHHFKLFRDNPNSPCYLKEGDFGWS